MSEPLFLSTHNALLFAHNYNHCQTAPTLLAKLCSKHLRKGKGLAGLDGAAQAGLILGGIRDIGAAEAAVMMGRYAPHSRPCDCRSSCCSGTIVNTDWSDANAYLASMVAHEMDGRKQLVMLWQSLIAKHFGFRWRIKELAEWAGVDRDTVADHQSIIRPWLERLEDRAFRAVDRRLHMGGLV